MEDALNTIQLEVAVYNHYWRKTFAILDKIYIGSHECDILLIQNNQYITEVELKISIQDLKRDFKKKVYNDHPIFKSWKIEKTKKNIKKLIRKKYYCVPKELYNKHILLIEELIPKEHGILLGFKSKNGNLCIIEKRKPQINITATKLINSELINLLRCQTHRIWRIRKNLIKKSHVLLH